MNTLTDAQRDRVLALIREGKSLRRIEHETGHRRETIAAYGRRAGLLGADVTELAAYREPVSAYEPYREAIEAALDEGRSLRALHAELVEHGELEASYSALKRYVRTQLVRARIEAGALRPSPSNRAIAPVVRERGARAASPYAGTLRALTRAA